MVFSLEGRWQITTVNNNLMHFDEIAAQMILRATQWHLTLCELIAILPEEVRRCFHKLKKEARVKSTIEY